MLFNSYEFIFAFLPAVFAVYFLLNRLRFFMLSKIWLVLSSLFFYSWWNISYLPLILGSIFLNFTIGKLLKREHGIPGNKTLLIFGICTNLFLLGYYKYADFFLANVNLMLAKNWPLLQLVLPLAISFFTFQQIAYLVDAYKGETKNYNFLDYILFVTFFPQLIAGPIVNHREMMPQFALLKNKLINFKNIALGSYIFFIGLGKKVVLADTFAIWATKASDETVVLTLVEAWIASLSYTLQLYFDFSGYTDMAIGAALLFNIKLPINFNSPYQAVNIQDFWRRWHITLNRFMTRYIYIPLGGKSKGKLRLYLNLMIVFLISGLWHGVGWTFIFWGFLHGLATVIHRWWTTLNIKMNTFVAWFITFNFINFAWVFFRAKTWADAIKVLKGMVGLNGVALPEAATRILAKVLPININISNQFYLDGLTITLLAIFAISLSLLIVATARNSMEMMENFQPNWRTAFFISFITVLAILSLNKVSEFLYFNF